MVFKGRISFVELINMPAGVLSKLYHIAVERAEARAEEAEKNGKTPKTTKKTKALTSQQLLIISI